MALGEVFSLADVISSANKIKADQQELSLAPLRRKYLEAQVAGTEQAQQLAANQDQRAGAEEQRKASEFSVQKKVQGITVLNAAAAEVAQNPAALSRWIDDIKQLDPNFSTVVTDANGQQRQMTPQEIQAEAKKIYDSTQAAILSLSPQLQEVANRHAATLAEIKARAGAEAGLAAQQNRYQLGQIEAQGEQSRLNNSQNPSGGAKLTEGERVSANYYGRMEAAEKLLSNKRPSSKDYVAALNLMEGGAVRSLASNQVMSESGQKYYQAASDWVRAKLRKESGAVISPQEMAQEIKTYFPLPNDPPSVVKQKAQARQQAQAGMRQMSGGAVQSVQPPQGGSLRVRFEDLPE